MFVYNKTVLRKVLSTLTMPRNARAFTASSKQGKFMKTIKGHQAITVANHDFISLSVSEFTQIPEIPTNRDSQRRVRKMKHTFDSAYYNNQIPTLTEVAIGYTAEDFVDPDSGLEYKKDQWFVIDGNTRKHYWLQFPDRAQATEHLTGKIHYLRSMEDVKFAYYPYNNAKSTEKASEILQGLAKRYNWAPRQAIFANGGYKSALDWAAYTPGEDTPDVFKAFNICFEALKILDSIPQQGDYTITRPYLPSLKCQAIIAACLLALRHNPNQLKLHDFIHRLASITEHEINTAIVKGEIDPVQIIAIEYTGNSCRRSKRQDAGPWLRGLARSTKFESQAVQMDFLMYWIQKYIEMPKVTYNFNKGVKPEHWNGAWMQSFPEEE